MTRRGHLLSDPSLAAWVLEQCAELAADAGADRRAAREDGAAAERGAGPYEAAGEACGATRGGEARGSAAAQRACQAPSWGALRIDELWRRLDNLQRFYPQPRLIVAHHETLCAFLPWLCVRGLLAREQTEAMLVRLEQVSVRTLERARAQLAARRDDRRPRRSD